MAYRLEYSLSLGSTKTGLTMAAQLVDTVGANVGSEVTSGFVEVGNGFYHWDYSSFPDDHRGGVEFYEDGTPGTILAYAAINPEEGEYLDIKVSTIAAAVWAVGTRTLTSFGTLVADIWANATRTLTSYGTLIADIWSYATRTLTSGASTAAEVWAYATRTLTQSAASVESAVAGETVTVYRDSTIYFTLTGLGSLAGRTAFYFTVKDDLDDDDSEALIQLDEAVGLLYSNGESATAGNGSITINNAATGSITIEIDAVEAAKYAARSYFYGVKIIRSGDPEIYPLSEGTFVIVRTATKARS